jgi:hypothetical protein
MLKRNTVLALGFAALATLSLSNPAPAANMNGAINGMLNGSLNGSLNGAFNGSLNGAINGSLNGAFNGAINGNSSSGVMFDVVTLQAVKLALPDGTELAFR